MITIGVVSDTHSLELPLQMIKDFKGVDFIIHAGDFCEMDDVNQFKEIKELRAVFGNRDDESIRRQFPRKDIFRCEEINIGIFHGEGPRKQVFRVVQEEFKKDDVHLVVFGHTHEPLHEEVGGVHFFNPGSPNDTIFSPFCSYGLIKIDGQKINAQIVKVK